MTALHNRPETEKGIWIACLAERMNASRSQVSRAVTSLEKKEFLRTSRARHKTVRFSPSGHAAAFRTFLSLHPHVEVAPILANSSLRILTAFTGLPVSVEQIARVSRTPAITVRRALNRLMQKGILVRQEKNHYQIALSGLQKLVQDYVLFELQKKAGLSGLICYGPNVVVRTEYSMPSGFVLSGLSVFHRFGVPIVQTTLQDYKSNLFDETPVQPSLEEAVVHALVRASKISSVREASYGMLVLHKNWQTLDKKMFLQVAGDFGINSCAQESLNLVKKFINGEPWPAPMIFGAGKPGGPFYPSTEEFQELVGQYA